MVKITLFTFSKYFPLFSPPSGSEAKYSAVLVTRDLEGIHKGGRYHEAGVSAWRRYVTQPLLSVQKQVSPTLH